MVSEGKQRSVGDSQGYPVDVGPRVCTKTGMEIMGHAVGTGEPDLFCSEVEIQGIDESVLSERSLVVAALEVKVGGVREGMDTRVCPPGGPGRLSSVTGVEALSPHHCIWFQGTGRR